MVMNCIAGSFLLYPAPRSWTFRLFSVENQNWGLKGMLAGQTFCAVIQKWSPELQMVERTAGRSQERSFQHSSQQHALWLSEQAGLGRHPASGLHSAQSSGSAQVWFLSYLPVFMSSILTDRPQSPACHPNISSK